MDWLEQWFGLNPDGGSGMIEAEILTAVGLVIAVGVVGGSSKLRRAVVRMLRALVPAVRS